jgi:hypothetical protein
MVRSASGEPDKALLCVLAEQAKAKACFAWRSNGNFPGPACGMRLRPAWAIFYIKIYKTQNILTGFK